MNNPEQFTSSQEHAAETQKRAAERSAELLKNAESSVESSPEQQHEQVETARRETKEVFAKEAGKESRGGGEPQGFGRGLRRVTGQEKRAAYQETMSRIRREMGAPAQAFSKFIHNGGVERASNAIGNSVARPNAVLSGSTAALILVSLLYIIAKIFGYPLSGFETIGAFVFGWIIGLIYDYARILVTGRTQ